MRKLGIAIAVIVVLLIAAALIVPRLIDVNEYHGQIQSQLEKRLGSFPQPTGRTSKSRRTKASVQDQPRPTMSAQRRLKQG